MEVEMGCKSFSELDDTNEQLETKVNNREATIECSSFKKLLLFHKILAKGKCC